MPGRALSTDIKVCSSVSLNWLYEEVCRHQMHKCFLLDEQRKGVLHIWKCWSLAPLKTVVCDWRFQVTLIIHWLCSFDSSCQIPPAGFASTRSAWHVYSKGVSHLRLPHTTGLLWLQHVPHLLESLSYSISFSVCGSIHTTMQTRFCELHVSFNPQQNQACFLKKQKEKNYLC